ncbi:MAG TPA: hypothetical protein VNR90_14900, partial [Vicinamibacterales bacterium]|nr:hypothetical protein [Vicinamibacterales bacterium]
MSGALVRRIAWGVALVLGVELAMREIARRSLLHLVLGGSAPVAALVIAAIVASAIAIAASRGRRAAGPLLTACFAVGIALQLQLGARLQSDGFYYFAYLRSIAFDHDVNFLNDYRMLGLGDKTYLFQPTRTGHAESAWTIGPAIVWAPFFAVGHVVATRLHASGAEVATDGTSFPYRQAVCVASLFYGLIGCWFAYRLTRLFFPGRVALPGVVFAVTGSFMLWYLVKEPSMTHAASMAAAAAFMWMWAATQPARTPRDWAALGLLLGLAALIRWQNALFALLPGFDALIALVRASRGGDRSAIRRTLADGSIFLAAAFVAFLPQLFAWHAIYGSWFARSPVGPQIRWTDPQLVDILWSARNGLFSTTPIACLAAIGLGIFAIARPAIGGPAVVAVLVMVYFNACIQDWWGSAGFGGRRFDGLVPLFAIGLAAFLDRAAAVVRRHAVASVTALLAAFAVWNLAWMGAAQEGSIRIGETVAFDRAWAAQARVVHRWFGNPFTYPASLVFALRNGVSPGDYDLLSTNRFLGDPLRPYGAVDVGNDGDEWLLGEGWHAAERDGAVTFRWAAAPATLRVPLDHAAPLRVQVRLHAFAYPNAPPQTLTIATDRG